jgi:hypothetical protein
MINIKGFGKKWPWPNENITLEFFWEGLKETMENLRQLIQCSN